MADQVSGIVDAVPGFLLSASASNQWVVDGNHSASGTTATGGLADAIGRKRVTVIAYGFITLSGILILVAFSFPKVRLLLLILG